MNSSFIDYTNKPIIPRMMTIREVANTGLLTEYTLRALVKQNKVPYVRANTKVLINFELLCEIFSDPEKYEL